MQAVCDNNAFKYQLFNFHQGNISLFQYCQMRDIDGIACDNYFIIPENKIKKEEIFIVENETFYRINRSHCKFASCELLKRQELVMGSYTEKTHLGYLNQQDVNYLLEFKNNIIDMELYWVDIFLKTIYEYLKNRKSSKASLLNNEAVQVMIGDVLIHIKSAEQYRSHSRDLFAKNICQNQSLAVIELRYATQLLAKLHGGRSFLAGNVIEMMMIFEYFRDIYFCDN